MAAVRNIVQFEHLNRSNSQHYVEINQQKLASQLNNKEDNMHNIIINADINYIALFTS